MLFFAKIIISHWNSNHFQSWMLPKLSKVSDSIYQGLYSVDSGFEMIEKFKNFCSMGANFCFFNMVRCAEIIISHQNSNHFQSWVSLESSKTYDSIYQNFHFVVRAFKTIEKFKKVYSLGAKIAFCVMICHTEIMISHWISHHFQSWMYLM
jgi:hypothetical protein